LERYGGAVRRYLLGSLRNDDAADEVFQEFSLKLVTGAFQKADANFGRFRSFLKTTLFHLIVDYQRRGKRNAAQPLVCDAPDRPLPEDRLAEEDAAWTRSWRDELLAKGWATLAKVEQSSGTPYYTVLRYRSEHPDERSQDIAAALDGKVNEGKAKKPLTSTSVRVLIHRARELLADQVLDLVRDSLDNASLDECEQELIDLNLLEYCKPALQRRRGETPEES
jgi:RNA polymerase sigma-70 factor (ECF subfamily)